MITRVLADAACTCTCTCVTEADVFQVLESRQLPLLRRRPATCDASPDVTPTDVTPGDAIVSNVIGCVYTTANHMTSWTRHSGTHVTSPIHHNSTHVTSSTRHSGTHVTSATRHSGTPVTSATGGDGRADSSISCLRDSVKTEPGSDEADMASDRDSDTSLVLTSSAPDVECHLCKILFETDDQLQQHLLSHMKPAADDS